MRLTEEEKNLLKLIHVKGEQYNEFKKDKGHETATSIMNQETVIDCYLCGAGKITMRAGDIMCSIRHPVDSQIQRELEMFLSEKVAEFFINLFKSG